MHRLIGWVRELIVRMTRVETVRHVGIATLRTAMPVYRRPAACCAPIGYLAPGQCAPHFAATADRAWLHIILPDGSSGWLQNNPGAVTVVEPDPTQVTVCIDPGHGGSDHGATGHGLVEKAVNLDVALKVGQYLRSAGNPVVRVWLTRTCDADVSLAFRSAMANAAGSHLFISIHHNAFNQISHGTETYYKSGSEATDEVRENSRRAACLIHQAIGMQVGGLCRQCGSFWKDRGVIGRRISGCDPRSYYSVLRLTEGPAILVEYLFISHPGDARCLARDDFRGALAEATGVGIGRFLKGEVPEVPCWFRTLEGL